MGHPPKCLRTKNERLNGKNADIKHGLLPAGDDPPLTKGFRKKYVRFGLLDCVCGCACFFNLGDCSRIYFC